MEQVGALLRPEITLATVAKLETGQISLTLDYINDFARVLDTTPIEIISVDASDGGSMRMLPVLGDIAAGNWAEELAQTGDFIPVAPDIAGPNAFALRPRGDSMDKIVQDGGFVVIDPDQRELIDGKAYAVRNGAGEATCKAFRASPPRLEPCSTNPAHQPIIIGSEPFVAIGRVVFAGMML